MRVSVGLFLVLGLIAVGCKKKEATAEDSQQMGADNGAVLGDPGPVVVAVPTPAVVTTTKVVQPVRPAFGAVGTPVGAAATVPAAPVTAQAPPASPVATVPVATVAQAKTVAATPVATAPAAVTGRGVPPPPGGRPKPGTK